MTTPKNITTLRVALCEVIDELRAHSITPEEAEAVSNASGKIVASLRVELEYARQRGEIPNLAFLK